MAYYTHYRGEHPIPTEDQPAIDEDRRRYAESDAEMRRIERELNVETPDPNPDYEIDRRDRANIQSTWQELGIDLDDIPADRNANPEARAEVTRRKREQVEGECINGHPYDPADPDLAYTHARAGYSTCRACRRESEIRSRARAIARREAREARRAQQEQDAAHHEMAA
ncbi:hypothetical protein [Kocuria kalidii]|uniref:hypothetical protein n=1 Tax=Kocuria kalidii TaxID=3376283 RepID=UPI00379D2CE4